MKNALQASYENTLPLQSLPLVKGGLPVLGNLHQLQPDKLHLLLEDWAKEYGEFYRLKIFNKDIVVVCQHDLIMQMLKNRLHVYNRPDNFVVTLKELKIDSLFTNDVNDWSTQRDIVTKSMNINKLRGAYEVFEGITNKLLEKWSRKADIGRDFSLVIDVRKYTFDMLSAISLGYEANSQNDQNNDFFNAMDKIFEVMNKGAQAPFALWRHYYTKYDKQTLASVGLVVEKINSIIDENVKRREGIEEGFADCNILSSLITENRNGGTLTQDQLVGNTFALIGAGFHTVGNTISWLTYNLANNPEVQERVHNEVMQCLADHGEISSFSYFDKLPLMNAFIKESMRVRPSAPLIFITTAQDVVLGGVEIPAGTDIYAHNGYLSRSDKHFKESAVFNIDRWLDKSAPKCEHNEKAYMPFSNGSTFCPGRNLAFLQIQMFIFNICRHFKVVKSDKTGEVSEHYHIGVDPSEIFISLKKRNPKDSTWYQATGAEVNQLQSNI